MLILSTSPPPLSEELWLPQGARVETAKVRTSYRAGLPVSSYARSSGFTRRAVRQFLKVARTSQEIKKVNYVYDYIHYLAKGELTADGTPGPKPKPWYCNQFILHYLLELPLDGIRPEPPHPAACVTIRYAPLGGIPDSLDIAHPYEALDLTRNWVADDIRYPYLTDVSPAILREVVRRLYADWSAKLDYANARALAEKDKDRPRYKCAVRTRPRYLITYADPSPKPGPDGEMVAGHDGGLYEGAGFKFHSQLPGGKLVFVAPLRWLR